MAVGSAMSLHSLAAMVHALGRPSSLVELIETAAEEASRALYAASVSISEIEPSSKTVRTVINVGDLGPGEERWPVDEVYQLDVYGRLAKAMNERTSWTDSVDDPDCDPFERDLLQRLDKGSSLATAIVVDGQLWGEFYATRHVGATPLDGESIAYAEVLMAILGSAISRSRREAALENLAFHDPLTGLLNRRGLDRRTAPMFEVVTGISRPVSVVMIDINGLKQVNDSFGHARGDRLLQAVAQALLTAFDDLEGTLVARVGGDEFTVVVDDHDPATVVATMNNVCRLTWGLGSAVGIAAGVSTAVITDRSTIEATDLFGAADRAQYLAKHAAVSTTVVSDEFRGVAG